MSYDNFNQGGGRPGFTEQPNSFEQGGGFQQGQPGQNYGGSQHAGSNGYNRDAYSGNNRSGYPANNGGFSNDGGNGSGSSFSRSSGYGNNGGNNWKNKGSGGWGGRGGFQKQVMTPEQLAAIEFPKRTVVLAGNYGAPDSLIPVIREIADICRNAGLTIRASSMDGFDKLVMNNVPDAEFHIPWKDFGGVTNAKSTFNSEICKEFAKRTLPEWGGLKESHQAFFCKNVRLVLGKNLDSHCQVAIIWSEDGVEGPANRGQRSSHAGHIAALCHACGIPVINLNNPNAVQRLRNLIEGQRNHG